MKNKNAITWGVVCSALFGILSYLVILGSSDIIWLQAVAKIILWPLSKSLLLIARIFPDVSIRVIGIRVSVIYMGFIGFIIGFCLNKLYVMIVRKKIQR